MTMPSSKPQLKIDVDKLYPELTAEQRAEAAYYLARYIDLIERIYLRTQGLTENDRIDSL